MSHYLLRPRKKQIVLDFNDIRNENKKAFSKRPKKHEKPHHSTLSQKLMKARLKENAKWVIDENITNGKGIIYLTRSKIHEKNAHLILSQKDDNSRSSKKTKLDNNGNIRNETTVGHLTRSKTREKQSQNVLNSKSRHKCNICDDNIRSETKTRVRYLTRSKIHEKNACLILSPKDGNSRSSKNTKLDNNGNIRNETTVKHLTRSKTREKQSQNLLNSKSRHKCNICVDDNIRGETKLRVRYKIQGTRLKIHKKQSHFTLSNEQTDFSEKTKSKKITIPYLLLHSLNSLNIEGADFNFNIKQNEKLKKTLSNAKKSRKKSTKVNQQIKSKASVISMQKGKNSQENENFNDDDLAEYLEFKNKAPKQKSLKDKFRQRNSFERYGVQTPTFEEVLDRKNKIERETDAFNAFEKEFQDLNDSLTFLTKKSNKVNSTEVQNLLDCKHLSSDKIKEYFQQNLDYIAGISNGNLPSERHERFKNFDMKDLTYSSSIMVFEDTQRNLLVELLEHHFNLDERTDYLFKVLLPEICLKIFMDEFGKTVTEAKNYLD